MAEEIRIKSLVISGEERPTTNLLPRVYYIQDDQCKEITQVLRLISLGLRSEFFRSDKRPRRDVIDGFSVASVYFACFFGAY